MSDLHRVNSLYGIQDVTDVFTGPVTNRELLPPLSNRRYVIHTIVVSSNGLGSASFSRDTDPGNVIVIQPMHFPAQGGVALEDIYKKIVPKNGFDVTTTGVGSQSVFVVFHVEPI